VCTDGRHNLASTSFPFEVDSGRDDERRTVAALPSQALPFSAIAHVKRALEVSVVRENEA
jgi:hypothetical protein